MIQHMEIMGILARALTTRSHPQESPPVSKYWVALDLKFLLALLNMLRSFGWDGVLIDIVAQVQQVILFTFCRK